MSLSLRSRTSLCTLPFLLFPACSDDVEPDLVGDASSVFPGAGDGDGPSGRDAGQGPFAPDDGSVSAPLDSGSWPPELDDASTPPMPAGSDDIYGQLVPRADSWWVHGAHIYHGSEEVELYGVNWFGLETETHALFGPVEAQRSVADFLAQVKELGFNALRVPLSPQSIDPGHATASWAVRDSLDTGREHFEELARAAADAGIYMLWDIHTCSSAVGFRKTGPLDPQCTGYGREKWLENLTTLAELAEQYSPWVLGIDLFNEPYGLTHAAWKELAEAGGEAVLRANPRLLTFVEGVGSEGYVDPDGVFWGENLTGVRDAPIVLPASRLVYSPHVYGPSVYAQPYFSTPTFPGNMPAIWDKHFGYLFDRGAALVPGEFGGRYVEQDRVWQDAFVDYLLEHDAHSFFYWCLNPNSGDTGGVLLDDFRSVNQDKLTLLRRLMR
jgi:endoglucanase